MPAPACAPADWAWCCRTMEQAFQDLRGLMTKAQDMVQLAQRFRCPALPSCRGLPWASRPAAVDEAGRPAARASPGAGPMQRAWQEPGRGRRRGGRGRRGDADGAGPDGHRLPRHQGHGRGVVPPAAVAAGTPRPHAQPTPCSAPCQGLGRTPGLLARPGCSQDARLSGACPHTGPCLAQLADFLAQRVDGAGGCMALPDVYCLFNRARGTELVSPDDLLQARTPQAAGGLLVRPGMPRAASGPWCLSVPPCLLTA